MKIEKQPFNVRCDVCKHEWVCAYTPMEMTKFSKLLNGVLCPMCGQDSKRIFTYQK